MPDKKNTIPFHFPNAGGIPILNQPRLTVTISVDLATGKLLPITIEGPEINFIALCDLLATQQQAIFREALMRAPGGAPGYIPPTGAETLGGNPGGKNDEKPEGTPA